ncbi:hypothetical protein D6764_03795 [Candidatus Woesearchaeota archaeon]|nr:MAG: hypothetical protein D6764_03795 [Candidatus Woesearchaeota archaeon]
MLVMGRFTLTVLSIILGALIAIAFILKGLISMRYEKLRRLQAINAAAKKKKASSSSKKAARKKSSARKTSSSRKRKK